MHPFRLRLVPLAGVALILAACSAGGAASNPTAAPTMAATPGPSVAAGPGVALADVALGTVLVDSSGRTLYVFTPDSAGKSACNGDCATNWPPLTADSVPALGTGLDAADFTVIKRDDGSSQVAFHDHPLYYFAADTAAGDTKGQGLNGKWFVVGSDGSMIGAAAAPSPAAASASPAAAGTAVNLGTTTLGSVLVDGAGKTLYIFTADSAGKSACNGDCATAWPPLMGATATPGTGLDAEDFATITRDDGSTQLTFYGMPLYTFAADAAAGDTKGQGLNGKWFVVGADGKPIK